MDKKRKIKECEYKRQKEEEKGKKWYFITIATDMMIYIPFILSDEQQGMAASSVNQFTAVA